jgi:hypothetical protein
MEPQSLEISHRNTFRGAISWFRRCSEKKKITSYAFHSVDLQHERKAISVLD